MCTPHLVSKARSTRRIERRQDFYRPLAELFVDLAVEFIESIGTTGNVKPRQLLVAWIECGGQKQRRSQAIRHVPHANFTSFHRQWEILLRDEAC
jgi:hypothetical protein